MFENVCENASSLLLKAEAHGEVTIQCQIGGFREDLGPSNRQFQRKRVDSNRENGAGEEDGDGEQGINTMVRAQWMWLQSQIIRQPVSGCCSEHQAQQMANEYRSTAAKRS